MKIIHLNSRLNIKFFILLNDIYKMYWIKKRLIDMYSFSFRVHFRAEKIVII
jgi:hypothetical protein